MQLLVGIRRNRRTSRFRAPKNAPLFLNIKYQIHGEGESESIPISYNDMENKIALGNYHAQLFEDSICDGCVTVKLNFIETVVDETTSALKELGDVIPAFSLVTAPDFFPYLDGNDIRSYYFLGKGKIIDAHFKEGGTINLSGIRQRANPHLKDPFSGDNAFKDRFLHDKSFDTLTAVVSTNEVPLKDNRKEFRLNYNRDYRSTSYMPDTGTGIFFPGWDVTYAADSIINPFFSTIGLGSPFPEDMKLCAAANGMWPVASPDAGRTFQGSLERFPLLGKPGTSMPLMDEEIGLHRDSPHVKEHSQLMGYGWDGEQGPFIRKCDSLGKVYINFTDIGRADYISNLLNPSIGFDMSRLRNMDSKELIDRMDCLREALEAIGRGRKKQPQYTKYWLVSAEKVEEWAMGANAYGISNSLIGETNEWAQVGIGLNGPGYLFLFAITKDRGIKLELENSTGKRRNQEVERLAICKIVKGCINTPSRIKWAVINMKLGVPASADQIKWNG